MKCCAYCGKGFPTLTFPKYAYKLVGKDYHVRWFCSYTCMLRYKRENPDVVRAEKTWKKKEVKRRIKMAWTKEERAEYMKRYRQEHKDEIYLQRKKWSLNNQEHIYRYNKEYCEAHKEQRRAYQKAYYHKHKGDEAFKKMNRDAQKRWRENNREKWNSYIYEYRKRKALEVRV